MVQEAIVLRSGQPLCLAVCLEAAAEVPGAISNPALVDLAGSVAEEAVVSVDSAVAVLAAAERAGAGNLFKS